MLAILIVTGTLNTSLMSPAALEPGKRIVLLHWSAFLNPLKHLKRRYFCLLEHPHAWAVMFGQSINASLFHLADANLLCYEPDQIPEIACLSSCC